MSIDITITNQKNSSKNDNSSSLVNHTSSSSTNNLLATTQSLYETKTLLCKNKCGYYGNSIQYEGYCSICYRKLKSSKFLNSNNNTSDNNMSSSSSTYLTSSVSFDDSSSLLSSSYYNNYDENKMKSGSDKQSQNQTIWNEHTNLSKFSSKQDKRKNSTFNKIFRRPSSTANNASALSSSSGGLSSQIQNTSLIDTVSKVADKAVNLVDQSINTLNSSSSLLSLTSSSSNDTANIIEFNNCLNKLLSPPSSASIPINSSSILLSSSHIRNNSKTYSSSSILTDFEDQFRIIFPQLYQDLVKQMKQFIDKFLDISHSRRKDSTASLNNNKQFEAVQDFYKKIHKYIQTSASIKSYFDNILTKLKTNSSNGNDSLFDNSNIESSNSSQLSNNSNPNDDLDRLNEAIMIMVESYINNNIYDYVFPSIMSEFEEQDMKLQKKIRSFYWITNEMIGTCIDDNSIFYRDSYEEALNSIVEVDSKRTAYEKMLCITECSKNIFKAINISANIKNSINEVITPLTSPTNEESPVIININDESINSNEINGAKKSQKAKSQAKTLASADDFLPALIYIVLKANPTMLYSNINFITRFAFEKRILQGEHAYHFCSLNAVIAHIENLNAHHLNMTQEEFENYCNNLVDMDGGSNVLRLMQSNLKMLSELKDKQKLLKQETLKLQTDINLFRQLMHNKFNTCLNNNKEKYTNNIEGFIRKNHVLDDNLDVIKFNESSKTLIEPLKPISANSEIPKSESENEFLSKTSDTSEDYKLNNIDFNINNDNNNLDLELKQISS